MENKERKNKDLTKQIGIQEIRQIGNPWLVRFMPKSGEVTKILEQLVLNFEKDTGQKVAYAKFSTEAGGGLEDITYAFSVGHEVGQLVVETRQGESELIAFSGYVDWDEDKPKVHFHGSFSDKTGNVFGGHINEIKKVGLVIILEVRFYGTPDGRRVRQELDESINVPLMKLPRYKGFGSLDQSEENERLKKENEELRIENEELKKKIKKLEDQPSTRNENLQKQIRDLQITSAKSTSDNGKLIAQVQVLLQRPRD